MHYTIQKSVCKLELYELLGGNVNLEHTILIVDDEIDIVNMLGDYFEFNGYQVITAFSGMEALQKAEKGPDLILLDVNMPDMDGLAVCRSIRILYPAPFYFSQRK